MLRFTCYKRENIKIYANGENNNRARRGETKTIARLMMKAVCFLLQPATENF